MKHPSPFGISGETVYVIECPYCRKRFQRKSRDTKLNPHKSPNGSPCSGRYGTLVNTQYK